MGIGLGSGVSIGVGFGSGFRVGGSTPNRDLVFTRGSSSSESLLEIFRVGLIRDNGTSSSSESPVTGGSRGACGFDDGPKRPVIRLEDRLSSSSSDPANHPLTPNVA